MNKKMRENERAHSQTHTHLKCAQGHKNIIRFNCWWHFFLLFSFMFAMLYSTRDFVIVYLIYMCCVCTVVMHTRLLAWAQSPFMFSIPLTWKIHTNISAFVWNKSLQFELKRSSFFVKCTRNAKRLESNPKCKWHDWIWNFLFQKAHFIRLNFAKKFHLHFHFTWIKTKPTHWNPQKNSFHFNCLLFVFIFHQTQD